MTATPKTIIPVKVNPRTIVAMEIGPRGKQGLAGGGLIDFVSTKTLGLDQWGVTPGGLILQGAIDGIITQANTDRESTENYGTNDYSSVAYLSERGLPPIFLAGKRINFSDGQIDMRPWVKLIALQSVLLDFSMRDPNEVFTAVTIRADTDGGLGQQQANISPALYGRDGNIHIQGPASDAASTGMKVGNSAAKEIDENNFRDTQPVRNVRVSGFHVCWETGNLDTYMMLVENFYFSGSSKATILFGPESAGGYANNSGERITFRNGNLVPYFGAGDCVVFDSRGYYGVLFDNVSFDFAGGCAVRFTENSGLFHVKVISGHIEKSVSDYLVVSESTSIDSVYGNRFTISNSEILASDNSYIPNATLPAGAYASGADTARRYLFKGKFRLSNLGGIYMEGYRQPYYHGDADKGMFTCDPDVYIEKWSPIMFRDYRQLPAKSLILNKGYDFSAGVIKVGPISKNTGSGYVTMDADTPLLTAVQYGAYVLECTSAGSGVNNTYGSAVAVFKLTAPDGTVLSTTITPGTIEVAAVAAQDAIPATLGNEAYPAQDAVPAVPATPGNGYDGGQIKFQVWATYRDFVVGDGFNIVIKAGQNLRYGAMPGIRHFDSYNVSATIDSSDGWDGSPACLLLQGNTDDGPNLELYNNYARVITPPIPVRGGEIYSTGLVVKAEGTTQNIDITNFYVRFYRRKQKPQPKITWMVKNSDTNPYSGSQCSVIFESEHELEALTDTLIISGADQPEFNGEFVVYSIADAKTAVIRIDPNAVTTATTTSGFICSVEYGGLEEITFDINPARPQTTLNDSGGTSFSTFYNDTGYPLHEELNGNGERLGWWRYAYMHRLQAQGDAEFAKLDLTVSHLNNPYVDPAIGHAVMDHVRIGLLAISPA